MYMLWVYKKFQGRTYKRDDPFSNASMISTLLFMVNIQKYIVELLFYLFVKDEELFDQQFLVVFRATIFSLELLFILVSIRHNFSIEHVSP
jgi:hypothetical protein